MNYKIYVIVVLVLLMGVNSSQGQTRSEATDKGAAIVGGGLSFSSQGGDLYGEERSTSITIIPSLLYFIAPGLGIGGDLSYYRYSEGDYSSTTWGAGPKIGYFLDSGSNIIPFVGGGINYLSMSAGDDSENGFRFKFGGGMLIRKDHMAISIEAAYLIDRFKFEGDSEITTGNTIAIGVGFAGLLYR